MEWVAPPVILTHTHQHDRVALGGRPFSSSSSFIYVHKNVISLNVIDPMTSIGTLLKLPGLLTGGPGCG